MTACKHVRRAAIVIPTECALCGVRIVLVSQDEYDFVRHYAALDLDVSAVGTELLARMVIV
jgi:hypothetical protein